MFFGTRIDCTILNTPNHPFRMNFLRIARGTARFMPTAPRLPLQSRGYADTVSDKIQLTLALPHQVPASPCPSYSVPSPYVQLILLSSTVYLQIYRCVCGNRKLLSKESTRHF